MLPVGEPKFRRRKADRPDEIVEAALQVFAAKGFAAARLDDIAARAGVSKGALYLYFATKEEIFRAVVELAIAPNLKGVLAMVAAHPGPFADLVAQFTARMAEVVENSPVGRVAKMVIGEAQNFPALAGVWHDELVAPALGAVAGAIAAAQARGEVRPGDPRAYALSLVGPMLLGAIWRETFVPVGAEPFDLSGLARQHAQAILTGMLTNESRAA
ncbi:TetR/AcrR family transcriptional regulator [Phenylobacterium sp.]|uniref:TetR/AcrR family transcriptional regulator n=1 Tax=Phenylobacterium sp. TaxID=1871053 RepID=UPI0035AE0DA4